MTSTQKIKERPILFSRPMVAALARGEKTQTRRVMKPQAIGVGLDCPYGHAGDRLWVREPWRIREDDGGAFICYSNGDELGFPDHDDDLRALAAQPNGDRHRHARYMPRWASRFLLEVVSLRVERVQDISEEDARAEGVESLDAALVEESLCQLASRYKLPLLASPRCWFVCLWDSIHGPGAWERNEWVWVIEFRRLDEQGGEP